MLLLRASELDVVAPDGRRYAVRAVRIWWPRGAGGVDGIDLLPGNLQLAAGAAGLGWSRVVWGVRIYRLTRFRTTQLVYGEELVGRDRCVDRARELANELASGRKP